MSTLCEQQRLILCTQSCPACVQGLLLASEWPCWSFCDEEAWVGAYGKFLEFFEKGDSDWEELLFKVWVSRVLNHTVRYGQPRCPGLPVSSRTGIC